MSIKISKINLELSKVTQEIENISQESTQHNVIGFTIPEEIEEEDWGD